MNFGINGCGAYIKAHDINPNNAQTQSVKSPLSYGRKNDSVSISPDAASFRELDGSVKEIASQIQSSVSQQRIEQLKAQIADGSYNVSSESVADAILARFGL